MQGNRFHFSWSSDNNTIAVFGMFSRDGIYLDFEYDDVEVSYRPSSINSDNSVSVLTVCKGARSTEIRCILRTFSNCGVVRRHRSGVPEISFEIV